MSSCYHFNFYVLKSQCALVCTVDIASKQMSFTFVINIKIELLAKAFNYIHHLLNTHADACVCVHLSISMCA